MTERPILRLDKLVIVGSYFLQKKQYLYSLKSLKETCHLVDDNVLDNLTTEIEYEGPNRSLYEFVGNLKLDQYVLFELSLLCEADLPEFAF